MKIRQKIVLLCAVVVIPLVFAGCHGSATQKAVEEIADVLLRGAVGAPMPAAPAASAPGGCTEALMALFVNPPANSADLSTALQDWTDAVGAHPDDPACQLGLCLLMLNRALENVAAELGYNLFEEIEPLDPTSLMTLAASDNPGGLVAAYKNLFLSKGAGVSTAGAIPGVDFTSEEVEAAVRRHLLPILYNANGGVYQRMAAFGDSGVTDALITMQPPGSEETYTLYPCDFNMMAASMQALRGFLLNVLAYEWAPGDWDPETPIVDLDADGDGVLTPDEYLPARPFGTIRTYGAEYMQQAYNAYVDAVDRALDATDAVPDDPTDVVHRAFLGDGLGFDEVGLFDYTPPENPLEVFQLILRHFQALLEGEQTLTIMFWNEEEVALARAEVQMDFRVNLPLMWLNPLPDIRVVLPKLAVVPDDETDLRAVRTVAAGEYYLVPDWTDADLTVNGVFPDLPDLMDTLQDYNRVALDHAGQIWGPVELDFDEADDWYWFEESETVGDLLSVVLLGWVPLW